MISLISSEIKNPQQNTAPENCKKLTFFLTNKSENTLVAALPLCYNGIKHILRRTF